MSAISEATAALSTLSQIEKNANIIGEGVSNLVGSLQSALQAVSAHRISVLDP